MTSISLDLLLKLLTTIALGALIGAEREMKKAKEDPKSASFAGLRTHILVSLLGFAGALLSENYSIAIVGVLLFGVILFFLGAYWQGSKNGSPFGLAAGFSGLVTFLVGVMALNQPLLAAVLAIATVLVLALKDPLHQFVQSLIPSEFLSAIKFIIVAFIVLPLLPRQAIDPWGLIVPFNAWLMVVFVSAISFVGYVLVKVLGTKRGIGLTAVLGGLASSTATTTSLAQQGHSNKRLALALTFGIVTTSAVMFVRAMIEVSVVNTLLLPQLIWTLGSMLAMSLLILAGLGWKLYQDRKNPKAETLELSSPFRLWPALQFGVLYVVILLVAELGNRYLGQSGVYAASVLSGLADIDAITLSLSNLAGEGKLMMSTAVNGITLAVMTNTVVKLVLVRVFGSRALFYRALLALGLVILSGGVAIVLGALV